MTENDRDLLRSRIRHPNLFALHVLWHLVKEYFCNPIGCPQSKWFKVHGQWQVNLVKRRIARSWERFSLSDSLKRQRWFWVLLASIAAVALIKFVLGDDAHKAFSDQLTASPANAGAWSLLTLLAGAPIAFILWKFRDTNALWQIENQRKDTNLKDFQKLSEWASGLHLIEAEKTVVTEDDKKVSETLKSSLTVTMNDNDSLRPPSRAEGAASLQIAAVYQLQVFLEGNYGKHFQRPAFALLKTVWLSLVQSHIQAWKPEFEDVLAKGSSATAEEKQPYRDWKKKLRAIHQSPLVVAINDALTRKHGRALQEHKDDLPLASFSGLSSNDLELDGFDLTQIKLQGADLRGAQLQGADLSDAQLQGADLLEAHLQGAYLSGAKLQGADLSVAELQGANLWGAQLQDANLWRAQLQGADLQGAQLQGADLQDAELQGAKFNSAQLEYLELTEVQRASIIVDDMIDWLAPSSPSLKTNPSNEPTSTN